MNNRLVNGFFLSAILLIGGCDSGKQLSRNSNRQEKAIDRPLKHVKSRADVLMVNPNSGGEFHLKTGTVIRIPKDAFVDATGAIVSELVQIEMEEYHSAADIFLSGITMHYEQNGESAPFESAGMFRIDGKCNGNSVEVAKGKSIEVELASNTNEGNYDFFQLNSQTANWEKIGTIEPSINRDKKIAADSIEQIKSAELTSKIPSFAEEGAIVLDLNIDYRKHKQLRDFYGLAWQVESTESANEIASSDWDYVDLISNGRGIDDFSLQLVNDDNIKEVKVKPVVSREERSRIEKKYAAAIAEEEKERVQVVQNTQRRLDNMSNFQRNLSVNGFGIYNCDRVIQYKQPLALKPKFILDGAELKSLPIYYLLSNDNSAVSQYYSTFNIDQFRYNRLIFILADGNVAYVTNQQLENLVRQTIKGSESSSLILNRTNQSIKTPEDFSILLNSI